MYGCVCHAEVSSGGCHIRSSCLSQWIHVESDDRAIALKREKLYKQGQKRRMSPKYILSPFLLLAWLADTEQFLQFIKPCLALLLTLLATTRLLKKPVAIIVSKGRACPRLLRKTPPWQPVHLYVSRRCMSAYSSIGATHESQGPWLQSYSPQ